MPQSITLQIGQCGNQIANKFWSLALLEQSITNKTGNYDESFATFFRNVELKTHNQNKSSGKISGLRARGLLVDMEEGVLNQILASETAGLFDNHQIISSNSGSGNNWAFGHHVYGPQFETAILEAVRKEAEFCDSLQSFVTIQSTGGGTGSGLGSYLAVLLEDEYPNVYKFSTAIVPSSVDDVVTSPYNSVLSLWKLGEYSDCVLPVDNEALISIVSRKQKLSDFTTKKVNAFVIGKKKQAHDEMNSVVANLLLNMTSSMRFPGRMNVDINDIVTNSVPFPKMNYLLSSMAPLTGTQDVKLPTQSSIDKIFSDAYLPETQLLTCDPRSGT